MLNRLVHLDNTRENMNEYNYSKNRIIDGLDEVIRRANESFDAHRAEQDRANELNRQVGEQRVETWQVGQRYLKWKRKTHNEREAIIQHRRTIHNWLTRYDEDTGYFINEFRRYLTASGNALANAADHASALGLFKASLKVMQWNG